MRTRTAILALFTALSLSNHSEASTNTINFDDYPYGGLTFASSNRYQSVGAVFSRDIPIYSVAAIEAQWWVDIFQAGGGSLPNVLPLTPSLPTGRTIDMLFVVPGTSIPAKTDFVSVLLADSEVGSETGTVQAYDANDNLLFTTNPTTPASSTVLVEIRAEGISRVRFTDSSDGLEIDNVAFNTPVAQHAPVLSIRLSQVELCWDTATNFLYQLEYRDAFTTNGWFPFGAPILGTGARFCTNDAILVGEPHRFYQLSVTNAP